MSRPQGSDRPDHAARRLIDAYLLDELDEAGARQLAEHVRDCPACAAELGGSTRLLELLRSLPEPAASPDFDTRILAAVLADRQRRDENRSWLANLPRQIVRGAMRTTGTLMVTVVAVALIGGAFVFAASAIISPTPQQTGDGRVPTEVATPTVAPTDTTRSAVPIGGPNSGNPTAPAPTSVVVTFPPVVTNPPLVTDGPTQQPTAPPPTAPVVTTQPTPAETVAPSATASPTSSSSVEPSPVVTASPTATPAPTASLTPAPTATPTPEPSATPTATASPSATPTASPSDTPTPTPDDSATPKPRRTPPPSPEPTESPFVTPAPESAQAPSASP